MRKMPLFIAEKSPAPRAMHSFEFKVLEGSIWNDSLTHLMKAGILEPPPISSIVETTSPSCSISVLACSKKLFAWFRTGEIMDSNSSLFME